MITLQNPSLQIYRKQAGLLVIDIQERLAAAMNKSEFDYFCHNVKILLKTAGILDMPVWVTEQYKKGLGPSIPEVAAEFPANTRPIDKIDFSCGVVPEVLEQIANSGCSQIILCGMESHVCVYQTARDLTGQNYQVFVPQDAIISRNSANREIGLHLMQQAGVIRTSTETIIFDLLQRAGTPEFKQISQLVR
jgi:nicotinamidase-related amidase